MGNKIMNNKKERTSKLIDLSEAISSINDEDRIAIGGFAIYQRPMASVREIIRQKIKSLTVIGVTNSIDTDILIGAGCLKRIESSYIGFENYGMAKNFRKSSEKGNIEVVDYPELISFDRFRASQENLSFWPSAGLGGTDIVKLNEEIKQFNCPLSGKILHAIPAAKPDVVIIHALAADKYGNVITPSFRNISQSLDITLSRACEKVIVTVEKIVSTNFLKRHPQLVEIPSHRVTSVSIAPFGAHPTSMLGRYLDDQEYWERYIDLSDNETIFKKHLNDYIYNLKDNNDYLNLIGGAKLSSLITVDTQI